MGPLSSVGAAAARLLSSAKSEVCGHVECITAVASPCPRSLTLSEQHLRAHVAVGPALLRQCQKGPHRK